ncbi:ATP-binding cassette domain-containing protein, partial [Clostridioides difficile]|nr:ATP-binding cassette domain-containing protein [Clostridioides difficile]
MAEFIYTMHNVRKAVGDKVILDNVTLSFFPGAKIGVVGPNGAGKSTKLKLMAGLDEPNNGDANLAKGATVGILLQKPPLTEDKTVHENVEEAVGDIKAKLARCEEVSAEMANPDADFDALMAEMGELQTELD